MDVEKDVIDYRLVCRTCLASDAEFYKLDAPIITDDDEEKISFLECLRYCTRLEDAPQFPIYICTECSTALQVAYNFIRNALEANDVLRRKLGSQRSNGFHSTPHKLTDHAEDSGSAAGSEQPMRFRCKICNEKVFTKKALKEHVKLHLDIISYSCQLCTYECKKRGHLIDHYSGTHNVQPTRDQLRPRSITASTIRTAQASLGNARKLPTSPAARGATPYERVTPKYSPEKSSPLLEKQKEQEEQLQKLQQQLELATVLTSNVSNDLKMLPSEMQNFDLNVTNNEMSVGNEFIVMADGTVQEVMGNGVVIEYINTGENVTLENGLVLNNLMQVANNGDASMVNMDVDDIIIEDEPAVTNNVMNCPITPEKGLQTSTNFEEEMPPPAIIENPNSKKVKCKICAASFATQTLLKTHMLTHNEIPHFFCDKCNFYTFFKIDLTQHYKTEHKMQPTQKQLQPKNKNKIGDDEGHHIYACDLCLYETNIRGNLRRHYLSKHQVEATDIQLRPIIDQMEMTQNSLLKSNFKQSKPDYPNGKMCGKCNQTFYWRNKLRDHMAEHSQTDQMADMGGPSRMSTVLPPATSTVVVTYANTLTTTSTPLNVSFDSSEPSADVVGAMVEINQGLPTVDGGLPLLDELTDVEATIDVVGYDITTNTTENDNQQQPHNTHVGSTVSSIPLDAVPQIVETDSAAIGNDIDFDFNGDALFDDFDDVDVDDDEDEGNGGGDDNEDLQDLLLTSDDDFEDMLEESSSGAVDTNAQRPYCVQCNKRFFSQYQFENHMFVHRGLAPYRCEMCTNLYNVKRALIRHYKAVHKKIPTRDMIQAKGDKMNVEPIPIELLDLQETKTVALMCAKCPFESTERQNLEIHLTTSHSIQSDNFILQKLPFECPRCIRSYASKARLVRHLERSHSLTAIIQQQTPQTTHQQQQQHQTHLAQQQQMQHQLQTGLLLQQRPTEEPQMMLQTPTEEPQMMLQSHQDALQAMPITDDLIGTTSAHCPITSTDTRSADMPGLADEAATDAATNAESTCANAEEGFLHCSLPTFANETTRDCLATLAPTSPLPSSAPTMPLLLSTARPPSSSPTSLSPLPSSVRPLLTSMPSLSPEPMPASETPLLTSLPSLSPSPTFPPSLPQIPTTSLQTSGKPLLTSLPSLSPLPLSTTPPPSSEPLSSASSAVQPLLTSLPSLSPLPLLTPPQPSPPLPQSLSPHPFSTPPLPAAPLQSSERPLQLSVSDLPSLAPLPPSLPSTSSEQPSSSSVSPTPSTQSEVQSLPPERTCNSPIVDNTPALTSMETLNTEVVCPTCLCTCASAGALARHKVEKHPNPQDWTCHICNCRYKSKSFLVSHIKRHKDRKYACDQCPKRFAVLSEFEVHKITHSGLKPHKCDQCPKAFSYANHLKRHQNMAHVGKRYACTVPNCERVFTTKSHLKTHEWDHSSTMPYHCDICQRPFKHRKLLLQHGSKVHQVLFSDEELAANYLHNVGYTNKHDFVVIVDGGQERLRRNVETEAFVAAAENTKQSDESGETSVKIETDTEALQQ